MQDCTNRAILTAMPVIPDYTAEEQALVERLRRGEEAAFLTLVDRYHQDLLRLALHYINNRTLAEEVVQETWLGVLCGIQRFKAHASLKTWLFRILTNRAKTKYKQEARLVSLLEEGDEEEEYDNATSLPYCGEPIRRTYHQRNGANPQGMIACRRDAPEGALLTQEIEELIVQIVMALPSTQRSVITLRDMAGCSADETCAVLGISAINQRVLLHRARTKVRQLLADYLDDNGLAKECYE